MVNYTKEDLIEKVKNSNVLSVETDRDIILITLDSGRKIIYTDKKEWIEDGDLEWIGDDVDYYRWVADLVRS